MTGYDRTHVKGVFRNREVFISRCACEKTPDSETLLTWTKMIAGCVVGVTSRNSMRSKGCTLGIILFVLFPLKKSTSLQGWNTCFCKSIDQHILIFLVSLPLQYTYIYTFWYPSFNVLKVRTHIYFDIYNICMYGCMDVYLVCIFICFDIHVYIYMWMYI